MSRQLRATIVMDFRNVHLTGHDLFASTRLLPKHETLVDPYLFSQRLIQTGNAPLQPGADHAVLRRVLAYRGQPSSVHDPVGYARSLAHQAQWKRDPKVNVTLRPLKYA